MTDRGTLITRERRRQHDAGKSGARRNESPQDIIDATDEFSGSTGHLFVYGVNINTAVVTRMSDEICAP
jgi:hypothetical protein